MTRILFSQTEHPFEAEREYTRALNSVKLEKVFAKPFLGALDGHRQTGFPLFLRNATVSVEFEISKFLLTRM